MGGWNRSAPRRVFAGKRRVSCLEGSSLTKGVDVWEGSLDLRGREERMKTYFLVYGERIIYPLLHTDDSFLHK